jgi:exopolyphosphatase/guanosine-5'-triphosphate,3'-diphosphate pyrophosphatase
VRVAAVDCGTNSIRLLVADPVITPDEANAGEPLVSLARRNQVVRLGQGVDRTGRLDPEAIERTLAVARTYADVCRSFGVERVRFVATSASRDASNAADFVAGVREVFAPWGIAPEVVSGDEEADLSFRGATGAVAGSGHSPPYLVVDLGGGSTELVRGSEAVDAAISVDVGSVRLTERHLPSDPPSETEVAAATTDVEEALDRAEEVVDFAPVRTLVGLAGSITTVTAHALGLRSYDSRAIHLSSLPVPQVLEAATSLLTMTRAERGQLPYMHPGRVDVIGAGALVWRQVVARVAARAGSDHVVPSERDILVGIALSVLTAG